MKDKHLKFITLFSVIFLALSLVAYAIIESMKPRVHRSSPYWGGSSVYEISHLMYESIANNSGIDPKTYYYQNVGNYLEDKSNLKAQTFFYIGDFPELNGEYVLVFYNGGKPNYIKFNKDNFYDFDWENKLISGGK